MYIELCLVLDSSIHSFMNFCIINMLFDTGKYFVAVQLIIPSSLPSVNTWPVLKQDNTASIFKIIQMADFGINAECYPSSGTPQYISKNDPL